jgi:hypothetical protein
MLISETYVNLKFSYFLLLFHAAVLIIVVATVSLCKCVTISNIVILLEEQHWNNLMTYQKQPTFYRFKFLNAIEIKQPLTFIFFKANRIFHDQEGPAATPVGPS